MILGLVNEMLACFVRPGGLCKIRLPIRIGAQQIPHTAVFHCAPQAVAHCNIRHGPPLEFHRRERQSRPSPKHTPL